MKRLPREELSGPAPCARAHHQLAPLPRHRLLLLGGHGNGEVDPRALNRLHSEQRARHSLKGIPSLGPDHLGSCFARRHLADSFILDTKALCWTELVCSGLRPTPRHSAALALQQGSRQIFLLGGQVAVGGLVGFTGRGGSDVESSDHTAASPDTPHHLGSPGSNRRPAEDWGPREELSHAELHCLGTDLGAWWTPSRASDKRLDDEDPAPAGGKRATGGRRLGAGDEPPQFTAGTIASIGSGRLLVFGGALVPVPLPAVPPNAQRASGSAQARTRFGDGVVSGDASLLELSTMRVLGLSPQAGPIIGGTSLTIEGERFSQTGALLVRFAVIVDVGSEAEERVELVVNAQLQSSTRATVVVPDFLIYLREGLVTVELGWLPPELLGSQHKPVDGESRGSPRPTHNTRLELLGNRESKDVRARASLSPRASLGSPRRKEVDKVRGRRRSLGSARAPSSPPLRAPPASPRAVRAHAEREARQALLAFANANKQDVGGCVLFSALPEAVRSLVEWTDDGVEFCYEGVTSASRCRLSGEGLSKSVAGEIASVSLTANDGLGRRRLHGGDQFWLASAAVGTAADVCTRSYP